MFHIVTRKTPPCPYCVAAKNYLESNKIEYKEIPIEEVIDTIRALGIKTVPAIFKTESLSMDSFLGGFDQLKTYKFV